VAPYIFPTFPRNINRAYHRVGTSTPPPDRSGGRGGSDPNGSNRRSRRLVVSRQLTATSSHSRQLTATHSNPRQVIGGPPLTKRLQLKVEETETLSRQLTATPSHSRHQKGLTIGSDRGFDHLVGLPSPPKRGGTVRTQWSDPM
jgi:hypothetical protein